MKAGTGVKLAWVSMACVLAVRSAAWGAGSIGQAITLSGNRLVADQTILGSWPSQADYTGPLIAGQGNAFLSTGNPAYQASAFSGGNYILASEGGNYLGDETWGLAVCSQISANPNSNIYRTALTTFFNTTVANYPGGTTGYANALVSAYSTQFSEYSQALIYLSEFTAAAAYVNSPYVSAWRSAVISTLAQVDDTSYYPVQSAGAALWALGSSGPLNATVISNSGLWNGVTLAQLPGIIAGRQIPSGIDAGGFYAYFGTNTGGYTEDAVYPILGLNAASSTGTYFSGVLSGKNWLASSTLASGANQGLIADNPNNPSVMNEVYAGESLQGLTTSFGVIWNGGTGTWSDATQWTSSPYSPNNGYPIGASYSPAIHAGIVTLNVNPTVQMLTMDGGTLTGSGSLTLAGGTLTGVVNLTGLTTITAATLVIGGSNQVMGGITGGGSLLVNAGTTLTSDGVKLLTGSWIINGTQVIRSSASGGAYGAYAAHNGSLTLSGTSEVSTLNFGVGGHLNLKNNALIVEATPANKAALLAQISADISSGAITSSTAASNPAYALVEVDNADLSALYFGGIQVDVNSIIITQALIGDANLDGAVTPADLLIWANNLNKSGSYSVGSGDFNSDGSVTPADLLLWANNFNNSIGGNGIPSLASGGSLSSGDGLTGGPSAAPEPASLFLLGLGSVLLLTRRRRTGPASGNFPRSVFRRLARPGEYGMNMRMAFSAALVIGGVSAASWAAVDPFTLQPIPTPPPMQPPTTQSAKTLAQGYGVSYSVNPLSPYASWSGLGPYYPGALPASTPFAAPTLSLWNDGLTLLQPSRNNAVLALLLAPNNRPVAAPLLTIATAPVSTALIGTPANAGVKTSTAVRPPLRATADVVPASGDGAVASASTVATPSIATPAVEAPTPVRPPLRVPLHISLISPSLPGY